MHVATTRRSIVNDPVILSDHVNVCSAICNKSTKAFQCLLQLKAYNLDINTEWIELVSSFTIATNLISLSTSKLDEAEEEIFASSLILYSWVSYLNIRHQQIFIFSWIHCQKSTGTSWQAMEMVLIHLKFYPNYYSYHERSIYIIKLSTSRTQWQWIVWSRFSSYDWYYSCWYGCVPNATSLQMMLKEPHTAEKSITASRVDFWMAEEIVMIDDCPGRYYIQACLQFENTIKEAVAW